VGVGKRLAEGSHDQADKLQLALGEAAIADAAGVVNPENVRPQRRSVFALDGSRLPDDGDAEETGIIGGRLAAPSISWTDCLVSLRLAARGSLPPSLVGCPLRRLVHRLI
jgi:hypothetical protein